MPRYTNDILARQTLHDLSHVSDRLAREQRRLTTGKQIERPEDDPFGAGRAVFLRNERSDVAQYIRNIGEAQAWIDASDVALSNAGDLMQRARELLVQAANGANDQTALNAIAQEMTQLKGALREQANATFAGDFLFAGTEIQAQPYPAPANAYVGNTTPVQRLIAQGQIVQVNQSGPAIFGPTGSNAFDLIDTVVADLTAGNRSALQNADLTNLDTVLDRLQSARATYGALANRLETQLSRLADQTVNVADLLSQTEDADMARTMVTFSQTESVYQAALQAGARVIQPSLLDFLR